MRIHALSTGTVVVKEAFLHPRPGLRRQADLFLPGPWAAPLPIHCWAVEHEGRLLLVDSGESADARDIAFARFSVDRDEELPGALAAAGLSPDDVAEVVLTHHHGDHVDGIVHVRCPVRIGREELRYAQSAFPSVMRRVLRQPLPDPFAPEIFEIAGEPFGAFDHSLPLSVDRRIVAVPTPGHTPGHVSVICIDDDGRHVMLAGDATDTLEQLLALRADAVAPDTRVHVATLERILAHCREHPTVYLPSHDPGSAGRLARGETVSAP
ncbi:MAG TPA: MBL fold metallo-hydrolase [Solirubrobacteraceae bacterium]|nr:MBL fold metallo-hydrolase [Solirubrobacteraceae bacterium]